MQYVLNRAATCPGELKGSTAAEEAMIAWNKIEEGCPITQGKGLGNLLKAKNLEEDIRHAVTLGFEKDYTASEMTELIIASIKGES